VTILKKVETKTETVVGLSAFSIDHDTGEKIWSQPTRDVETSQDYYLVSCPTCGSQKIDPTSSDAQVKAAERLACELEDAAGVHTQREPLPGRPAEPSTPIINNNGSWYCLGCFVWLAIASLTYGGLVLALWANWLSPSLLSKISCIFPLAGAIPTILLPYFGHRKWSEETKRHVDAVNVYHREMEVYRDKERAHRKLDEEHKREWSRGNELAWENLKADPEYTRRRDQVLSEQRKLKDNLSFRCGRCGCSFTHSYWEFPDAPQNCALFLHT